MRRSSFLLVPALMLVLGACSGLIPDVDGLTDVYGLDGVTVVVRDPGVDGAVVPAASGATTLSGSIDAVFDLDGIDVPAAVTRIARAGSVSDAITLDPSITVRVPDTGADAPATITFSAADLALTFRRDGARISDVVGATAFVPGIVAVRQACGTPDDGVVPCTYLAELAADAIVVIEATSAAALFAALMDGGEFRVEGVLEVTLAEPGVPAGTDLELTLRAVPEAGAIRFR